MTVPAAPDAATAMPADAIDHPAWCEQSRCTADPSTQTASYHPNLGGQHCSADLPLNQRPGNRPIPPHAVAWLSQAVALWRCSTYLHITLDRHIELAMPVASAAPILAGLSALVISALNDAEMNQ